VLLASNSMPNHEQMKVGAVKDIYWASVHRVRRLLVVFEGLHKSQTSAVNLNSAVGTHVASELSRDLYHSKVVVSVPGMLHCRQIDYKGKLCCGWDNVWSSRYKEVYGFLGFLNDCWMWFGKLLSECPKLVGVV
jgi:hypothetical protein